MLDALLSTLLVLPDLIALTGFCGRYRGVFIV